MKRLLASAILPVVAACAATIELKEHEAKMADQRAGCDERIRRLDEARRSAERESAAAKRRAGVDVVGLETRVEALEATLAEKQRLLDDVSSQLVELQGAFSRLSAKRRAEITAEQSRKRHVDSVLARLRARFQRVFAAEVERKAVAIAEEPDALRITFLDGALFTKGSARLGKTGTERLARLSEALRVEKDVRLQIDVHTDGRTEETGAFRDTWAVTGRQGLVFVRALQKNGVDPSRLSYRSRGGFGPKVGKEDAEGRLRNRRIELRLLPPPLAP